MRVPEFTVETQSLKRNASQLKGHAGTLGHAAGEINSLKNQMHFSGSFAQIKSSLGRIATALGSEKSKVDALGNALGQIASRYESAEREIAGTQKKPGISIAWLSGMVAASGKIFGLESHGEAKGDILGGSFQASNDSGLKWKYVTGKNGKRIKVLDSASLVDAKVSGEVHLAKGSAKGKIGPAEGEAEAKIATVAASGKLSMTLFKNGKLDPRLEAGVEASATALEGSAKGSIGSKDNNVHGRAEGKLASAAASAKGSAGRFTVEDKTTGEKKTVIGVKGEAKAEAYLAQGKASGGFSLFGVKIDVGVTGKAGGAGVSAGGELTTGGASGSIGAGLGVGIGFDFSVDWSGFKLPWKK